LASAEPIEIGLSSARSDQAPPVRVPLASLACAEDLGKMA
jgi:hypothetical protein